jgi:hypothetical protein
MTAEIYALHNLISYTAQEAYKNPITYEILATNCFFLGATITGNKTTKIAARADPNIIVQSITLVPGLSLHPGSKNIWW